MVRKALWLAGFVCIIAGLESTGFAIGEGPEIDAGSAVSALSVLGAGFLMLRDRFKP